MESCQTVDVAVGIAIENSRDEPGDLFDRYILLADTVAIANSFVSVVERFGSPTNATWKVADRSENIDEFVCRLAVVRSVALKTRIIMSSVVRSTRAVLEEDRVLDRTFLFWFFCFQGKSSESFRSR